VDGNFVKFRAVYDDLTDEVGRSTHAFLQERLRNWFSSLDETPMCIRSLRGLKRDWISNGGMRTQGKQ
jgi:hypothetical protein